VIKTVEIMQYKLHKGKGAVFHLIMQEISVPLHQSYGIDVVAFGNSLHDPDYYYLIRAFNSEKSMAKVLDAFYTSSEWSNGPRENIILCIENSIKTVVNLPSVSVNGIRI